MDASTYEVQTLIGLRDHRDPLFFQFSFANVRVKELKQIFPITNGDLHPNKDMRHSAESVMRWRSMTREQQQVHKDHASASVRRQKRARSRDTVRQAANSSEAARSVTPAPESEPEEPELAPMNTRMVSLADSEDLREDFVKELEDKVTKAAPAHLVGKAPNTIAQQNDSVVMKVKKALIQKFHLLKDTMRPSKTLARAAHPEQHALLVIINDVADPKKGGGSLSLREVRRKKPQMIVCCDSKSNVKHVVNKLIRGFSRDSIDHDKYEHIRIFDDEDLTSVMESWDRGRETFPVPSISDTVDRFVERGRQIRPRSNSV